MMDPAARIRIFTDEPTFTADILTRLEDFDFHDVQPLFQDDREIAGDVENADILVLDLEQRGSQAKEFLNVDKPIDIPVIFLGHPPEYLGRFSDTVIRSLPKPIDFGVLVELLAEFGLLIAQRINR